MPISDIRAGFGRSYGLELAVLLGFQVIQNLYEKAFISPKVASKSARHECSTRRERSGLSESSTGVQMHAITIKSETDW